jgi:dUTP pyrophosphatase
MTSREFYVNVPLKRLTDDAIIPTYAKYGDAGADLYANEEVVIAKNGGRAIVSTGIAVAIPDGFVGLVHPRSGTAAKNGLTVTNAPGTIDSGYRGEIKVLLINHGSEHLGFHKGDRIAQLVVQEFFTAVFTEVDDLEVSERGTGGFGSTNLVAAA